MSYTVGVSRSGTAGKRARLSQERHLGGPPLSLASGNVSRWVRVAGLAFGLVRAVVASADCSTAICSGNPCTITGNHNISNGCVLNFGAKNVTIAPGAQLKTSGVCNVGPDDDCPVFTIRAGSLTHKGLLQARGGQLTIEVLGAFTTQDAGGELGRINVGDTAAEDGGGALDLRAAGAVTISTTLTADGGGSLFVSGCTVTLNGTLTASEGDIEVAYRQGFTASAGAVISSDDNTISCRDADEDGVCDVSPGGLVCSPDAAGDDYCVGIQDVVVSPAAALSAGGVGPCTGCGNGAREGDEACDDGNLEPCDGCGPTCQLTPAGSACDDFDACTTSDVCQCFEADCSDEGFCLGQQISCDDGNSCTTTACDPDVGCLFLLVDCGDGNACTTDGCIPASGCVHGPTNCNDQNACTTDSCNPSSGCIHQLVTCNDGYPCTIDACDPARGCVITGVDHALCNDGLACTWDFCLPGQGCVHYPLATCDDGDACTANDMCLDAECPCPAGRCQGTPISCDDGDVCTADGCDPATGCSHGPLTGPTCDDGNPCTTGDTCQDGVCLAGATGCSLTWAIPNPTPICSSDPCSWNQERFGGAIAADGTLVAVAADSACEENPGSTCDQCLGRPGYVYLFDAETGELLRSIRNPTGTATLTFGSSLTLQGDALFVGDPGYPGVEVVYEFSPMTGALRRTFTDPAGSTHGDFGDAIALVDGNLVVGAPREDLPGLTSAGAVYLFDTTTGALLHTLHAPDAQSQGLFGRSVTGVGGDVLVGAPGQWTAASSAIGAAYLFDRTTGGLLHRFQSPSTQYGFGWTVGALGSDVLVGEPPRAVHLFNGAGGAFIRSFPSPSSGSGIDFGATITTRGDTLLVGAPDLGFDAGSVYLFDGNAGVLRKTIRSPNPSEFCDEGGCCFGGGFGSAVAFIDNAPLVSAPRGSWGPSDFGGVMFRFPVVCGDGALDAGEECDDGNTADGDCCSSACRLDPLGTACAGGCDSRCDGAGTCLVDWCDDGNACTSGDRCVSQMCPCAPGMCQGTPVSCDDDDPCTNDGCSAATGCDHTPTSGGLCNDGNPCTAGDTCQSGFCRSGAIACTLPRAFPNPTVACAGYRERFGAPIAVDGTLIAVAASAECTLEEEPGYPICDECLAASGYVHLLDGVTGQLRRSIPNPTGEATSFGASLALVGDELFVGAPLGGVVYDFSVATGALLRSLSGYGRFGQSLVLVDGKLVVGAPLEDAPGASAAGAVHVFDAATGVPLQTLHAPDPRSFGYFGNSLARAGSSLLVGAPRQQLTGSPALGAAYLFEVATGVLLHTLQPPTAGAPPINAFGFGQALASLGGDVFVAQPRTAVHLFDGTTGALLRSFPFPWPVGSGIDFGATIAARNGKLLVGAPDHLSSDTGSAYVFDVATGAVQKKIQSPAPTEFCDEAGCYFGGGFGSTVAFVDDALLVSAPQGSWESSEFRGVVFLFPGACGDGVLDPQEDCDDSNTTNGDCCSSACDADPAGTPCAGGCDPGSCDGAGICVTGN